MIFILQDHEKELTVTLISIFLGFLLCFLPFCILSGNNKLKILSTVHCLVRTEVVYELYQSWLRLQKKFSADYFLNTLVL
jgi:hypothetical protein